MPVWGDKGLLNASERSSTALSAHLHNSTSRSHSQPSLKPSPALEMEACVDETGASRCSSPNYITGKKKQNKECRQGAGEANWKDEPRRRQGRGAQQDARSRGQKIAQCCCLRPAHSPGGSDMELGGPEDCVWLHWDVWVYSLSGRARAAAVASLSNILIVINAVTWRIQ